MKIIITLLLSLFFTSIIAQSISNNEQTIKEILLSQLRYGISGEYCETDVSTYKYTQRDLEILIPIVKRILKERNINILEEKQFKYEIKKRYNVSSSDTDIICIVNGRVSDSLVFHRNDPLVSPTYDVIYILPKEQIILPLFALPEIIDYKNEYPQFYLQEIKLPSIISIGEMIDVKIYKWGDLQNIDKLRLENIEHLIKINKFR